MVFLLGTLCRGQFIEVNATSPVSYPITIGGFNDYNYIEGFTFDMEGNLLVAGISRSQILLDPKYLEAP